MSGKILRPFLKKSFQIYLLEILHYLVALDRMFILCLFFNLKLQKVTGDLTLPFLHVFTGIPCIRVILK